MKQTKEENLNNKSNKITGLISVANLVVAPELIAATVLIVAAVPGTFPVNAQQRLPKPWLNKNLLLVVFVFNKESATSPVNKLSTQRITASVIA